MMPSFDFKPKYGTIYYDTVFNSTGATNSISPAHDRNKRTFTQRNGTADTSALDSCLFREKLLLNNEIRALSI